LRVYGLEKLVGEKKGEKLWNVGSRYRFSDKSCRTDQKPINLLKNRQDLLYQLPSPFTRVHSDHSRTRKRIDKKFRFLLEENQYFPLKQAYFDYLDFMESGPMHRKQKEKFYNSIAYSIWNLLSYESDYNLLQHDFKELSSHKPMFRIIQRWAKLGIAEVKQVVKNKSDRTQYFVKRLVPELPDVLYTFDRIQFENNENLKENIEIHFEETQVGAKSKYGITKKERIKYLGELYGEEKI
ncbi:hypothetical protein CH376_16490, partial [Leptospira adleri]